MRLIGGNHILALRRFVVTSFLPLFHNNIRQLSFHSRGFCFVCGQLAGRDNDFTGEARMLLRYNFLSGRQLQAAVAPPDYLDRTSDSDGDTTMTFPSDYVERVYAGVLGKMIAVYLGRPIEGWSYEMIMERFGEISYYVHEALGVPLVVTDDDLSGTFTFVRAMPDYGNSLDLTPAQIAQTWLNYIVEGKTILWWGGIGDVTEHTAYIRLKQGILPPRSGSIELNGPVMAEQIGSQIFIDSWGMIAPGDPELAADLARRAACVSHDGEAIYGAQVVAALVAQAFVESDINKLIDAAVSVIPSDSTTYRMIEQVRNWQARQPDWHQTLGQIDSEYSRERYPGNCHIVPNHARIIMACSMATTIFNSPCWSSILLALTRIAIPAMSAALWE